MNLNKVEEYKYYEEMLSNQKNDTSLYMTTLFEYINLLTIDKEYDLLINVLEKPLEDTFISSKENRLVIVNKLVEILLKTEDYVKLKGVLETRKDLISKDSELLMQKFYLAVCFEGLDEIDNAITTLESIRDDISSKNIVNKYLKLSMLVLKNNDLDLAKKYYSKAIKFDTSKNNTTFLLAEVDLLMAEKNYLKALEVYQDFFIKTKNKYRYLDRYIYLQIALNNLSDAYAFYQKYYDVIKRVLSKESRFRFYQASIKLMSKLRKFDELANLEKLLVDLFVSKTPFTNSYDYILNVLDSSINQKFLKIRDIIHFVFKKMDNTSFFSKIVYTKLDSGKANLLHFSKSLLLEKTLDIDVRKNNIFSNLINQNYKEIYDKDDFSIFEDDLFLRENDSYIFVKEIENFSYLVCYVAKDDFYNIKKFFDISCLILKKLINDLYNHGKNDKLLKNILSMYSTEETGVFLIRNNQIELLNEYSKVLLSESRNFVSFEDFQNHLIKNIYIDELVKKDNIILKYQKEDIIEINFSILTDDLDIYLFGRLFKKKENVNKYRRFDDLVNFGFNFDGSILMFNLRNYHDFMKDYSYNRYDNFYEKIYGIFRESSRSHFHSAYKEGMDNFYLVLKTKDKRVLKRINDDVLDFSKLEADIRISGVNFNQTLDFESIADLKYLNSLTTSSNRVLFESANYRTNREVARTILINLENIILEKNLKLCYKLICDWKTNKFHYIYVDLLDKVLLGNKDSLNRVIKANNLEAKWDDIVSLTLIKDVRNYNRSSVFFMDVSCKTILDKKTFSKIIGRKNTKSFSGSSIVYILDYVDYLNYKKQLDLNITFGFKNVFDNLKLSDIEDLDKAEFLIVNNSELNNKNFSYFYEIISKKDIKLIYDHESYDLSRSFLVDNHINYVMGEAYPKLKSLKDLVD